jgi:hypothetical protein
VTPYSPCLVGQRANWPYNHRWIDPFLSMGVGIAAAAVRINREEKAKGKTTSESYESLKRRINMLLEKDEQKAVKAG